MHKIGSKTLEVLQNKAMFDLKCLLHKLGLKSVHREHVLSDFFRGVWPPPGV